MQALIGTDNGLIKYLVQDGKSSNKIDVISQFGKQEKEMEITSMTIINENEKKILYGTKKGILNIFNITNTLSSISLTDEIIGTHVVDPNK